MVICDATCATDPQIQAAIPPGIDPTGGIVSTVYSHSIVVTDAGGTVTLEEGQYLLVLPNGTNILLPTEPHFLHVDPTPTTAAQHAEVVRSSRAFANACYRRNGNYLTLLGE